jgi:hypothetical protein
MSVTQCPQLIALYKLPMAANDDQNHTPAIKS